MKTLLGLSIFCFLLVPGTSPGQNTTDTRSTLSALPGVAIRVEPPSPELEERGMTEFVFAVEIERRLIEAGIPVLRFDDGDEEPGSPTLYLEVIALIDDLVDQVSYNIRLELRQDVQLGRDPDSKIYHAATWSVGGMGIYAKGWRQAIIDDVLGYMDEFVEAYTAANPSGD